MKDPCIFENPKRRPILMQIEEEKKPRISFGERVSRWIFGVFFCLGYFQITFLFPDIFPEPIAGILMLLCLLSVALVACLQFFDRIRR